MADFFRGLAGGFSTGLQFGGAMRDRQMREELAQAYAQPTTSQGYTAETGQQLEELAKTGAYDIVPQYAPPAEGQTQGIFTGYQAVPKAGLDLQGDMPAAPRAFNPQQVQEYGGQRVAGKFDPTQLRGLQMQEAARVLGSYGDVRGAAQLQAQAEEQAYQAKYRPLQLQQVEGQIAGQGLTQEAQRLAIAEAARAAEERKSILDARSALAERRKEGPLTAAAISEVSGQFKLDPTQFLKAEDAVNTLEIKDLKRNLSTAALKGEAGVNQFLADKFDPDKTDNIKPMITKAKDGSFQVTYGDRVLSEYGSHKNMMSLVGGVINMIDQNPFDTLKTLSALNAQAAATRASEASATLSNTRSEGLKKDSATLAKLDKIDQQIEALTPTEMNSPVGRGLLMQRNAIVAGATKQVPVGAAPRAERPALSESEVTQRAKAYLEAKEVNPDTGKRFTLDEAIDKVRGTPPAPGTPRAAAAALNAALGSGDPFAAPAAGRAQQTRGLTTVPAEPARNAPVARNPYVDELGRPLINPPAGPGSYASTAIPAAAAAVEGVVGTQASATRYLQAKIARNEPLTATDRARAVQLGLIR